MCGWGRGLNLLFLGYPLEGLRIRVGVMARQVNVEVLPRGRGRRSSYQVKPGCGVLLGMVLIAWAIEIADVGFHVFGFDLDALGIWPRKVHGLSGVFLSPWLHGGWAHLTHNTVSFLGLGFVMSLAEGTRFLRTTFQLVIISGIGTWLIGRGGSVHIGASGLIYGYFGYLILRAWTERRPLWIVTGILVALASGGMIWGVLPSEEGISWEAHLCGFIGGLALGRKHGQARK